MRINELAKKYGVGNDELILLLKKAGYEVKGQQAEVDFDMLGALDRHFSWSSTPAKKTRAKAKTKAKAKSKVESKAKAKATAKAKTKTKAKAKVTTAVKAKAKTKTKAKAKTKTKAKLTAREALAAVEDAPSRVKAKTKLIRKAKPEPEPPVVVVETVEAKVEAPRKESKAAATAVEKTVEKKKKPTVRVEAEAPAKVEAEPVAADKSAVEAPPAEIPAAETVDKEVTAPPAEKVDRKSERAGKQAVEPVKPIKPIKPKRRAAKIIGHVDLEPRKQRKPKKSTAELEAQNRAVRESVRRTMAKLETTRKTKRKKVKLTDEEKADMTPVEVQDRSTPLMLAAALGVSLEDVIAQCEELDIEVEANTELDHDMIEIISGELGMVVQVEAVYGEARLLEEAQIDPEKLEPRSPIVTVMGHVDHGKTSILDYIRHSRVAEGEAGGITQHIGAYEVETPQGSITFIDTPGHEAFTSMRSRGARLTDIVVLVVAADDGVMPQTIEAINHTRAAGVPMVVAVNKIDIPGVNAAAVKQQLMQYEVVVEEYGGEVVAVDVSARNGTGIEKLLEMILLQAEILELKADPTARPQGVVVEVKKEQGRGILVTALVQQGTLKVGDVIVMGSEYGKVRSLIDHSGKAIKFATPSMPALILGANGTPEAGDKFIGVKDERIAREVSESRKQTQTARAVQPSKAMTLEDLYAHIQKGEVKELKIIIKGDTDGSVEALRESLAPMRVEDVGIKVMHHAVGTVSESDVLLAEGSDAIIIAFGTKVAPKAKDLAKRMGVDIRSYRIIYEVIADIDLAIKGLLEPIFEERVLGKAEVRQLFKVSRKGVIAGSMVIQGAVTRNANARVLREGEVVFDGKIESLKRFKDDVKEVQENFECGISLVGFDNLIENDIIEAYVVEERVRVF